MKHKVESASYFEFACPHLSDHRTQKAKTEQIDHGRSVPFFFHRPSVPDLRALLGHSRSELRGDKKTSIVPQSPLLSRFVPDIKNQLSNHGTFESFNLRPAFDLHEIPVISLCTSSYLQPRARLAALFPIKNLVALCKDSKIGNDHFSSVYRPLSEIIGFKKTELRNESLS